MMAYPVPVDLSKSLVQQGFSRYGAVASLADLLFPQDQLGDGLQLHIRRPFVNLPDL